MSDQFAALVLFVFYALLHQWTFRCQRVSRGILLLARDTAAGVPQLHAQLMLDRMVPLMWLKWLFWLACGYFTWLAWHWWGLALYLLYGFFLFGYVDIVSPWPSYSHLLALHRDRLRSGKAGPIAYLTLNPWLDHIEHEMAAGVHFEKATTGVWLGRAAEARRLAPQRAEGDPGQRPSGTDTGT